MSDKSEQTNIDLLYSLTLDTFFSHYENRSSLNRLFHRIMPLYGSTIVSVGLLAKTLEKSLVSFPIYFTGLFFVIGLTLCIYGRVKIKLEMITPYDLYKEYIEDAAETLDTPEFKATMIKRIGEEFKLNQKALHHRGLFAFWAIILFIFQIISIAVWVII